VDGNILVNDAITGKISLEGDTWNNPHYLTLRGSEATNASQIIIPKGDTAEPFKIISPEAEIQFRVKGVFNLIVRQHEVRIGDPWDTTAVSLKVNGNKVWAHEVEVNLTDWSDEVFDKNYKLMPLHQLESYIETNKHLPDIPTEEEVLKNGIKLGEMNALLLKKVEELTLYVIELKKEVEDLKGNGDN